MSYFIMIARHRTEQNPLPAQEAPPHQPQPPPHQRTRKPENPWIMPWILQREERGCYRTLTLITTNIPGYRNFTRMEPAFLHLIEERITPRLRKSTTNFRKSLEVGLKLAITLRHLSTGRKLHVTAISLEGWKSIDHLVQPTTYNHHRMTRRSRDRM